MVSKSGRPERRANRRTIDWSMGLKAGKSDALIVVDVQRDFCPGGTLAVRDGDLVVPVINDYVKKFERAGATVIFTRDWHPPDHSSFKSQGGPWPPHCVKGSDGASFHAALRVPSGAEIVSKGDSRAEAYSGFQGTNLAEKLRGRGVKRIFVGGLATDYCVKETVLDGLKEQFEVYHLDDASRGVNVKPEDSEKALELMTAKGCKRIRLEEIQ